jgi:DNA-binding CsgD family transcriptional regulator
VRYGWSCGGQGPPRRGEIVYTDSLLPKEDVRRTAFYNEWAAHHGIDHAAGLVVEQHGAPEGTPLTVLTLVRAPGMPAFEPAELRPLQALHPHLYRAVRTHWALAGSRDTRRSVEQALEGLPQPLLLLASSGSIEFANGAGRDLLARERVAELRHGALAAFGHLPREALADALDAAARGEGSTLTTWWEEGGRLRPAVLHFRPLQGESAYRRFWPRAAALLQVESPAEAAHDAARLGAAVARFRLTPAEARVLGCVQRGLTPAEAAAEIGVRLSTVRAQLSSLFQKTGTRRQAELMRLVG